MPTKTVRDKCDERRAIADDLAEYAGGAQMMCISQIQRYMGLSRDKTIEYLKPLRPSEVAPREPKGKKLYLVFQLAALIYERQGI